MDKELLTVTEAARRLSLGRATTYQLVQRGELPVVRIGRAVRVPARALEAWILARTTGGDVRDGDMLRTWPGQTDASEGEEVIMKRYGLQ